MIDRLENIQKIAAALAVCAILAVMNVYGLGLWFEIEGRSYIHQPDDPNAEKQGPYRFEYTYHTTEVNYYDEGGDERQTVVRIDEASNFALNGVMQNIRLATFALAVASAYLAYMIYGITGISDRQKLSGILRQLQFGASASLLLGIVILGLVSQSLPQAILDDDSSLASDESYIGCVGDMSLGFWGEGACNDYEDPSGLSEGEEPSVIGSKINIKWHPGIALFLIAIGCLVSGGGTFYIIHEIEKEWDEHIKPLHERIEKKETVVKGELDRIQQLHRDLDENEKEMRAVEQRLEEVSSAASRINYDEIEALNRELERISSMAETVGALNNSLNESLVIARKETSEKERRATLAEGEIENDLSSKERLESEIEQMRQKHEEDMQLSDRMTREIGSLREMAEQAELRGEKAEAELREQKPELTSVLDSYEVVKKAYDQVLEEKFLLEQDIGKLEYSTSQDQGREETAKAEKKDMVRRVKELSTEIKQMKVTNTSNRKESRELKKKVRTLQALADTAEKKMEDALEKLDKESKKSKELETKIEALRLEMQDPREVAEQLDSVRDLTKDYKERAKQHAEDAKKERVRQKQLRQELRTLQKADKANSDVRNKLNTQLARNKKELDKATAKLNEAERKLESEKNRRRELAGQLEFLSDSLKENLSEAQLSEKIEGIKTEAILAKDEGASALASAEQMTRENQDLEKKLNDVRKMSVTDDSKAAETAKEALESVIPTSKIGSSLIVKNLIKETEHTYRLVKALSEQDMAKGVLSIENPLGKELFGTKEGQEISMGNIKFKILEIKN
ncbi:MAG: hypothetical protein BEU05_01305 [Marine Group III euryarchaeote CG-Bathy2]|uniref:Viral A-type inclusion protein n=3 Tax=Methanobacteriati TaxID=3366610 RepID=A0A075HRK3_9EURY|nr:viral A-type inclusion protein [uncultured marine group II/III euryarchaeote KM3_15_B02]AIF17032.1 viral A-type inclusion protein [uncultured marine group II/III euryarchaeote KM3_75_F08]OIR10556.1 MAG: hypothetical protein BEU05_01305 [Marine Group III euryarchaeote CG-Bathy2]